MIEKKKTNKILVYRYISVFIIGILIIIFFQYSPIKNSMHIANYEKSSSLQLKNGIPPSDVNSCTVILCAKLVGPGHPLIDPLAALSGARHLFVNYFLNQTNYGIIEGGFIQTTYGYRGVSTAFVKPYAWDHGGLQWKFPIYQCAQFIHCLHKQTNEYHQSSLPYHFLFGPNSNSFMWWIFNQCSIKLSPSFSKYPYVGIDYFLLHNFSLTKT